MTGRDMVGYGQQPPDPRWPNGARIALSFVLNYEEGGERTPLEGDPTSEAFLHEVINAPPKVGRRPTFTAAGRGGEAWPRTRHQHA